MSRMDNPYVLSDLHRLTDKDSLVGVQDGAGEGRTELKGQWKKAAMDLFRVFCNMEIYCRVRKLESNTHPLTQI